MRMQMVNLGTGTRASAQLDFFLAHVFIGKLHTAQAVL